MGGTLSAQRHEGGRGMGRGQDQGRHQETNHKPCEYAFTQPESKARMPGQAPEAQQLCHRPGWHFSTPTAYQNLLKNTKITLLVSTPDS